MNETTRRATSLAMAFAILVSGLFVLLAVPQEARADSTVLLDCDFEDADPELGDLSGWVHTFDSTGTAEIVSDGQGAGLGSKTLKLGAGTGMILDLDADLNGLPYTLHFVTGGNTSEMVFGARSAESNGANPELLFDFSSGVVMDGDWNTLFTGVSSGSFHAFDVQVAENRSWRMTYNGTTSGWTAPSSLLDATQLFILVSSGSAYLDNIVITASEPPQDHWLEGWGQRKAIWLEQSYVEGTGYQMPIEIVGTSGEDTTAANIGSLTAPRVYANDLSYSDFRDVRFTQDDGVTALPYWIQSIDAGSSSAFMWVKIPYDMSLADRVIYVYWDNNKALPVSSGSQTFEWFTDFNSASGLSGSGLSSATFSGGTMTVSPSSAPGVILSNFTTYGDVALGARVSTTDRAAAFGFAEPSEPADNCIKWYGIADSKVTLAKSVVGTPWTNSNSQMYDPSEMTVHHLYWFSNQGAIWIAGGQEQNQFYGTVPGFEMAFYASVPVGADAVFDYAFIRKAASMSGGVIVKYDGIGDAVLAPRGDNGPILLNASFTFAPGDGQLEVEFTPAEYVYTTYEWDFGDGTNSSETAPSHTYAEEGTYNVTLNVSSAGLTASSWKLVTVSLTPGVMSTPEVELIVGASYAYAPVCNVPAPSWSMDTNATFLSINTSSGEVTGTAAPGDVGWYYVHLTAATDPAAAQQYILWVEPLDWQVTVIITAKASDLKVLVSYALSDPSLAWAVRNVTWDFGDGSPVQSGATAMHTYDKAGTYSITCTVTNVLDDDTAGTKTVTVKKPTAPTTVIPGGGGGGGGSSSSDKRSALPILILPIAFIFLLIAVVLSTGRTAKGRRRKR